MDVNSVICCIYTDILQSWKSIYTTLYIQSVGGVMSLSESCFFCQSAQIKYLNGNRCFCSSLVLELKKQILQFAAALGDFPGYKQTFQFGQKAFEWNESRRLIILKSLQCKDNLLCKWLL